MRITNVTKLLQITKIVVFDTEYGVGIVTIVVTTEMEGCL